MKILGLVLLLASAAFAQPKNTTITRGNLLPKVQYETDGTATTVNYCVDSAAGNDGNSCIGTSTNCCATPQAAINKIPKLMRQGVTMTLLAGTYPGFIVSGFTDDFGYQTTTGGLSIIGTMVNSTLASGTATGTVSSATLGSTVLPLGQGTITDGTQNWTAHDLTGRFITMSNGITQAVIADNTATTITSVGFFSPLPTGGVTTYTIQDPATIINTCAVRPASVAIPASTSGGAGIEVIGNNTTYLSRSIGLQQLRITNNACNGILHAGASSLYVKAVQVRASGASAFGMEGIRISNTTQGDVPYTDIANVDVELNDSVLTAAAVFFGAGGGSIAIANFSNAQIFGAGVQIGASNTGASFPRLSSLQQLNITGFLGGIFFGGGRFDDPTNGTQMMNVACGNSTGVGVQMGYGGVNPTLGQLSSQAELSSLRGTRISTCGTGILAVGPVAMDVLGGIECAVGTTCIDARLGADVIFKQNQMAQDGGTNAIAMDANVITTTAFTDVNTSSCLSDSYGTRVCAR